MTELGTTRKQRQRKLGIDCPDRLVWKSWDAGEEHRKKIIIKNVDARAQTVFYKLPQAKTTFIMDYPEPTTLSSGMSLEVEIRFCPTKVVEIHDVVEITVKGRGSFPVYLDCLTPFAKVTAPKSEDFGYVAVMSTSTRTIPVKNIGTVPLDYYWEVPEPFSIQPSEGTLPIGETVQLEVSFTPTDGMVGVGQAVCKMSDNEEVLTVVQFSGIGKYPFIRFLKDTEEIVEKPVHRRAALVEPVDHVRSLMNFKEVMVGKTVVSEVILENPSPVDATVTLGVQENELPNAFEVSPSQTVIIPSGGQKEFKVTFHARDAGVLARSVFEWKTVAGNTICLETKGAVLGPRVKSSTNYLNYGTVDLEKMPSEKERTRAIQLKNGSDVVAHYQVVCTSPGASFSVSPCAGAIPAKGSVVVKITFQPTLPMNYLRRLFLLVKDAEDALFVDVFGTAYNQDSRPLSFGLPQVEAFFLRLARGLGQRTPEELEQMANLVERDVTPGNEEEALTLNTWRDIEMETNAADTLDTAVTKWGKKRRGRITLQETLPFPPALLPFNVDNKPLLFDVQHPQTQSVSVFNSTPSVAEAAWFVPNNSPFVVLPQTQEVMPGETVHFQVSLRSQAAAVDRAQYLECYVNYKQMRSFRFVEEKSFTPPHCFTVLCCMEKNANNNSNGSNPSGASEAATLVTFGVPHVRFPSTKVGVPSFRVAALQNRSDRDFFYDMRNVNIGKVSEKDAKNVYVNVTHADGNTRCVGFAEDGTNAESSSVVFNCYPASGAVAAQSQVLTLLQFLPTLHATYDGEATFTLGNNIKDSVRLPIGVEADIPRLLWEDCEEEILFCPTCVTGESRKEVYIRNPTPLSLSYRFEWSDELLGVARVEPSSGVVGPEERQLVTLFFSPEKARRYSGRVDLLVMDLASRAEPPSYLPTRDCMNAITGGGDEERKEARVVMREYMVSMPFRGEGAYGILELEPTTMSLRDVDCGTPQVVSFNLFNSGTCPLQYQVRHFLSKEPEGWRQGMKAPLYRNETGTLPARSHTTVLVTVQPTVGMCEYIFYALLSGPGTDISAIPDSNSVEDIRKNPHCVLTMTGTRPALQVTDVRSLTLLRSHLWAALSLNDVNQQLSAMVQPDDLDESAFEFPQYIQGLTPIPMQLGCGHLHGNPTVVTLQLTNTGDCDTSFRILYPGESDVQQETWFVVDETLKEVQYVMDNRIMEITPRSGCIPVGHSMELTIVYRRTHVGKHVLPFLLRVDEGKKSLIVLEGRTAPASRPILSTPSLKELTPVALGDMEPPMQSITLVNPTQSAIHYTVDREAIQSITEENYGFPVLQCVNPVGRVEPRGMVELSWYFRPLEAKAYTLYVPIQLDMISLDNEEEETITVTFHGQGFHPKKVSTQAAKQLVEGSFLALPPTPSLRLPELPVSLSLDVCSLGTVPFFSLHRRVCTVTNHHPTDRYSFQWEVGHHFGALVVLAPSSGVLGPGQSVSCRLCFYSGNLSQFVERSLLCIISNETVIEREMHQLSLDPSASRASEDICIVHPADASSKAVLKKKEREVVTDIPTPYMSVRALEDKLQSTLQQGQKRTLKPGGEAVEPVIWNALELLLQVNVVPYEVYQASHHEGGTLRPRR
ncbi:hypothetical protein AGDE_00013 [Angomonas deanei]|uniref:Abnormal spindle-like microcephaly-associated protein ASH domain-containing protein n=1 Tax=Angomonas deanei TaxID=59799 RepID=A0A7G2C414_9TRYP|nr:hypothetical protein AGDE_00013 [Angomonas deanei]CAD2214456.1 hypothetical protein, conserved [Angomonas deanei]|eukprot:EPY43907.1 hypothetical protein AGDE_00013 [Angomonas deanei]